MGELDSMFRYCLGGYYGCVLFHRINREMAYRNTPARAQPVTIHGRAQGIRRSAP